MLRASSPVAVGAVAGEAITTEARQLTLQRDHVQPATTDASRLVACLQSVRHATQQPHAMVEAVARLVIVAASSLVAARQGLQPSDRILPDVCGVAWLFDTVALCHHPRDIPPRGRKLSGAQR
eukprot:COSAG01_NODE_29649_length_633_cov_0.786517_1_plen_122_part_10